MIKVAINGYGTIGKRVADAVAAQKDMKVIGVSKTRPNAEAFVAKQRGTHSTLQIFPRKRLLKKSVSLGMLVANHFFHAGIVLENPRKSNGCPRNRASVPFFRRIFGTRCLRCGNRSERISVGRRAPTRRTGEKILPRPGKIPSHTANMGMQLPLDERRRCGFGYRPVRRDRAGAHLDRTRRHYAFLRAFGSAAPRQ